MNTNVIEEASRLILVILVAILLLQIVTKGNGMNWITSKFSNGDTSSNGGSSNNGPQGKFITAPPPTAISNVFQTIANGLNKAAKNGVS